MIRLRRAWCRLVHRDPKYVMFGGGATYWCRRCGLEWENPALDGPIRGRDLL